MTIILILIITSFQLGAYFYIYIKIPQIFTVIGITTYSLWLITYLVTILKNPGIPTIDTYLDHNKKVYIEESESDVGYLTCGICNVFVKKDVQIGHCLSCKVCILGKCDYL